MNDGAQPVQTVCIVGGGTSGWLTAAVLSKTLPVKVTLVETPSIGTIGVGEATIPTIRDLNDLVGIKHSDMLRDAGATCKLGIAFRDWGCPGDDYLHPFGVLGAATKPLDFFQHYLIGKQADSSLSLETFSPAAAAARAGRFDLPAADVRNPWSGAGFAYHLDATNYAELLKATAIRI